MQSVIFIHRFICEVSFLFIALYAKRPYYLVLYISTLLRLSVPRCPPTSRLAAPLPQHLNPCSTRTVRGTVHPDTRGLWSNDIEDPDNATRTVSLLCSAIHVKQVQGVPRAGIPK